ncbi:MAG: T9SS type A sorting domain-containing protein [Ignavibacteria bacterium]
MQNYLNEVKQAGTYSVTFNALHLSSGVYFYSIRAGNFHQVKKMI